MRGAIQDRMPAPQDEHFFHPLASRLLYGIETEEGFLKMKKANDPESVDDDARFKTDYEITLGGFLCGYLDIEWKKQWVDLERWPYPAANVAIHPLAQWERGRFTTRESNKIQSFRAMPGTSFWVGLSRDYQRAFILPATAVLKAPKVLQETRFPGKPPLPVFAVDPAHGYLARNAEEFSQYIQNHIEKHYR
tara:strand:- start:1632 stop:2207 length:576 start_codon:yes stop_codon:yes gene_type:complete